MTSILSLLLFGSSASSLPAGTQDEKTSIVIGERVRFPSEVLKEERELLISLPRDYAHSRDTYPVLYLLDGEWHFQHTSGLVQFLSWERVKRTPEMIVVAIVNTHRGRDFSPAKWPGYDDYTGGGDTFILFLAQELIPYIDRIYRTQPRKILAGHSLAGTFTLYTFLTQPDLFDAYIALSPALFWHDRFMLRKAEAFLEDHKELAKTLYICHEYTEGPPASTMKEFEDAFRARAPSGLKWQCLTKDQDDHFSYVHKALHDGLDYIFRSDGRD